MTLVKLMHRELKEAGAVLVRQSKHAVWRLPNGAQVVTAVSPSDRKALQNMRAQIKRGLTSGK